ncbi:hypothetical protein LZ30DRAFT_739273 [Colletotrichum cereale]|nr:hypothetical protein LZ30DRAFT_739273 [Colletotrichum cereale]
MQFTQKLENIQVHSELAAAKDLINKQNEHINTYKMEINRIQLQLDEQSHVVQSQDNAINELRFQPFRSSDETSLGKELEFQQTGKD